MLPRYPSLPKALSPPGSLQVIVRKLRLSGDFDFAGVAARTPGFVGADLQALTKEAAAVAVSRIFSSLQQAPMGSNLEGMPVEVCSEQSRLLGHREAGCAVQTSCHRNQEHAMSKPQ